MREAAISALRHLAVSPPAQPGQESSHSFPLMAAYRGVSEVLPPAIELLSAVSPTESHNTTETFYYSYS